MSQLLWTQKQDIGPAARCNAAMVYVSGQGRIVLFGGQTADNSTTGLSNDTWEWDGENWTQYADIGPAPRSLHAMTYDSSRGRIVLFGGIVVILISRLPDSTHLADAARTNVALAARPLRPARPMACDRKGE